MKNNNTGLTIPNEIIAQTNLGDEITLQTFPSVMVLKGTKLTALEVLQVIEALESVTDTLYATLLNKFPKEDDCDDCTFCEGFLEDCVDVPNWAKEVCGIDPDTKLCICAEQDSGRILLEPTDYEHDITDIDEDTLEVLADMGICLGELNESIMSKEIIYHV